MIKTQSSDRRFGRRALTGVAVMAIAAAGGAWTGCGDDEQDQAQQAIDEVEQEAEEASEEAQQQAEEAQQEAEEAVGEAEQEGEEAQGEAEQETQETEDQSGGGPGGY